ncbi:hypothetical protein GCM10010470_41660 [Saccharopolyspora taberi]|uniref:Transposase n=1 Tax=Saccharopolyspora taberi TaxID=60895 RepID=A0ABN3VG71_9PSEU
MSCKVLVRNQRVYRIRRKEEKIPHSSRRSEDGKALIRSSAAVRAPARRYFARGHELFTTVAFDLRAARTRGAATDGSPTMTPSLTVA